MARLLTAFVFAGVVWGQAPDPKALVQQSIQNYDRDWRAGMHWAYTQTDITRSDGTKEVDVSEVIPIEGTPYERLISKDGRPLSPDEQHKEDQKYEKALRQRQRETPSEREARIHKYENERAFIKEVPDAFHFAMEGEESVDGRAAWIVSLKPRPEFEPATSHAALLKHIEGKLWIDKQDIQWSKAEAHVIDTISIGWILARIGPGTNIKMDFTRVTSNLWMPKSLDISGAARVMIFHTKNLNETLTFAGYHPDDGSRRAVTQRKAGPGQSFR